MDKKPEAKIATKKIELSTNLCTTTNPLVKVDKKLLGTKKKQTVAASRIQRLLEGWKEPAEVEKDGGRVEKQTKTKTLQRACWW